MSLKNISIGILLIATVVLGGLYFQETRKASQAAAMAEGLQQKVSELESSLQAQDKQAARLRTEMEDTHAKAAAKIQAADQVREKFQAGLTNQAKRAAEMAAGSTNAKSANPMAGLFKNPEMKEMIKAQQKTAFSAMIDKNYAKFFADAHLTPDQSAALKDAMMNKQMASADIGMSMMSDDADAAKRADLGQQVKAANDAADAQIKQLLGDDNFSLFQTHEKSMGERMAVSGFKDQMASGPTALTGDQEQQLIQAMGDERQNFKFTTDLSDKSKFTGDFTAMFTDDKMNAYFQEVGQLNQQYLSRAQGILSADQLTSFQKYLDNQQTLQKAGMQMAAKMFAPAKAGGN